MIFSWHRYQARLHARRVRCAFHLAKYHTAYELSRAAL
jgi:hypothetical protein